MPHNKTKKTISMRRYALNFLFLTYLPYPLEAQSAILEECQFMSTPMLQAIREVAIDETWGGGTIDGRGGIDTLTWRGPGTLLMRPEKHFSIEIIDLRNEVFDTVVVNAEMIQSAELRELEIVGDWFDQIILDPLVTWTRSTDAAFSSQLFRTEGAQLPFTVRAQLGDHVVGAPNLLLQTQEGPLGEFSIETSIDPVVTIPDDDQRSITLSWPSGGFITPNLEDIASTTEVITLDLRNRRPDTIVIDPLSLAGTVPRQIMIESDATDRWIIAQDDCWQPSEAAQGGLRSLVFNSGQPTEISLINANSQAGDQQINIFTKGIAEVPGYRHLSADSRYTLDAIDLRNGGKDILIVRNDAHLRQGFPVFIEGDETLDEIWIEGTAGWQIAYHDFGVMAVSPFAGGDFSVALAPGLKLALLPTPDFLNDPRMLTFPSYPGLHNEDGDGKGLHLTRGGFVNFSSKQLIGRSNLYLVNGIMNVMRISPEIFADAARDVTITGDQTQDIILSENMPEPSLEIPGQVVWRINRPDQQTQTITAIGFAYIQYATLD